MSISTKDKTSYVLFVSGPTASGKTDLSLKLAHQLGGEIVNADLGQFYKPLSVGTAKPDWKNNSIEHHLFDILNEPEDFNVCLYRQMLLDKIKEIWKKERLAIVVGGSLFYIKSIFFPLPKLASSELNDLDDIDDLHDKQNLWNSLKKIDPKRAALLHPNDAYRIKRALKIWKETGQLPSLLEPSLSLPFNMRILFIDLPRDELYKRIDQRTIHMIKNEGWIEEVQFLKKTKWKSFLKKKKLIGYPEILEWLDNGGIKDEIPSLIELIQQKTRNYAKRQVAFWKYLRNLLKKTSVQSHYFCRNSTVSNFGCVLDEITNMISREYK